MTQRIVNLGSPDRGNGDKIRDAFSKVNDNFTELYNLNDLAQTPDWPNVQNKPFSTIGTGLQVVDDQLVATGSVVGVGSLIGDVRGSVYADDSTLLVDGINGTIPASVVQGTFTGSVIGNVTGNITGNVTGNVSGNLTGDVQGNVTGNLQGNVTGDVSGNAGTVTNGVYITGSYADPTWITELSGSKITGNISADLKGSVFADDSTLLVDAISGTIPYSVISGTPTYATVASTGSYNDLINLPVLFSGSYNDLSNKPTNLSEFVNDQGFITVDQVPQTFSIGFAADDSTVRNISAGESVKISGSGGISTSSDTEGNIVIDGSGIAPSIANLVFVDGATTTIDTTDSSGITFVPVVNFNSDVAVENNLNVTNRINASDLVANTLTLSPSGVPGMTSATNITLSAGNAVVISNSVLRLKSFTTSERNALSPSSGDIFFNSTSDNISFYQGTEWKELSTITSFNELLDAPGDYSGNQNKFVKVNGTGTGLEFVADPGYLTDITGEDLADLANVDTAGVAAGDTLYYNGTNWVKNSGPVMQFNITADGTSNYVFAGSAFPTSASDPILYLYRGVTYIFNNQAGATHPLEIRLSNGGLPYTNGVSGNQIGVQYFTVPMNAPATLYYQCTNHSTMGGTINCVI